MFKSSYDRARTLARAALRTEQLVGVIAAYPDSQREVSRWTKETAFEKIEDMAVPTEPNLLAWNDYIWPEDKFDNEATTRPHRAVNLTWDQADILLWNQIAHEIGVMPQAPVLTKLVDLKNGILVNAYDDRGMDIISITKEAISELYQQFDTWLLDYDRPRMADAFGTSPQV
ncbi:DUF3885 domain-containing protein [Asticcacaulis sp. EMRT-3]|uniref:DUF3885 domain-containing protein n=1 Tax=Asticcacaulis sp. EMRT-3 TaxID=3040349 RepID=UPI0024AEF48D|nr:DUF3885 domain-containing protein [Asticcacaulis sp. EMRT-3]MDI7776289.1 DUF3885 domain-containing protein [Asticcacaulis sp. EMRT-3]